MRLHFQWPGIAAIFMMTPALKAQVFRNLDFSERCDTCKTGLAGWQISWANTGVQCGPADNDRNTALLISNAKDGVGFVEQSVDLKPGSMRGADEASIFTVSARIRTDSVVGRGAGLNIAFYDIEGTLLMTKDMGFGSFSWATGTSDWHAINVKALCPEFTTHVKLGAILYGEGKAMFDDYRVEIIPIDGRKPDATAEAYVRAACDTIALHSLRRDSIDIDELRTVALLIAGDDGDPRDHHLAVEYLLATVHDHHSFLMKPEEVKAWQGDGPPTAIEHAKYEVIEGCGYISVPHFSSIDSLLMVAFADTIQQALARMEASGVKAWIIDLRQNTGGNMAPMICGLGPLFDEGALGQLIDVNGKVQRWYYRDGAYGWDGEVEVRAPCPVKLKRRLPIAVLLSQRTGSSGECTAISFIGNSNTRSFGLPTWGLTTGNGEFDLPDGAKMFLASTVMADRNGHAFRGPLQPDEPITDQPMDWSYDATLQAALDWISSQR